MPRLSKIGEVIVSRLSSLKSLKDETSPIGHSGSIGAVRERRLSRLVKDLLPRGIEVDSGFLCDCVGGISPQLDCIISEADQIPCLDFDDIFRLVPVEKALMCIEIKSTLTTDGIAQLKHQAKTVNDLPRCRGSSKDGIAEMPPTKFSVIALDSQVSRDAIRAMISENLQIRQVTVIGEYSIRNRAWDTVDIETVEAGDEFFETRKAFCWLLNAVDDVIRYRAEHFPASSRRTSWEPHLEGTSQLRRA